MNEEQILRKLRKINKEQDLLGIPDVRKLGWGTQRYAHAMRKVEQLGAEFTKYRRKYEELTGKEFNRSLLD